MTKKSPKVQIQFINQALQQSAASLATAKTLMKELEDSLSEFLPSPKDLPGIIGKFDGTYLVTDDNQKFQVPENYASKSKLVYGDTLKMIEGAEGATFKQIERVKRTILSGILAKKDGKFVVLTSDGSHNLIPAAVSFHHGQEGDEARVIVPEEHRNCSFATLDEIPTRDAEFKIPAPKVEVEGEHEVKHEETKSVTSVSEITSINIPEVLTTKPVEIKPVVKKQKEAVRSITTEPEVKPRFRKVTPEFDPRIKPIPQPEPFPLVKKPAAPLQSPPLPPPGNGAVTSLVGDDDLR
ncbi:MAG: hypothetical protein NT141_00385 [candidate division WWE3 bacterium]|nr:hypothetical protein [candidate division WWE3 bacterium]